MRILHFVCEKIVFVLFVSIAVMVFLVRGRKAFDDIDDFLERHDLADINREGV